MLFRSSTIWRVLTAADIKPHRSVYWLNSHDPDFDAKAQDICKLYVQAPVLYQHGELVICTDEKTGMQILQRKHPTILVEPDTEQQNRATFEHEGRATSVRGHGRDGAARTTNAARRAGQNRGVRAGRE